MAIKFNGTNSMKFNGTNNIDLYEPYTFTFNNISGVLTPATTNIVTLSASLTLHMTFTPSDGTSGYTVS